MGPARRASLPSSPAVKTKTEIYDDQVDTFADSVRTLLEQTFAEARGECLDLGNGDWDATLAQSSGDALAKFEAELAALPGDEDAPTMRWTGSQPVVHEEFQQEAPKRPATKPVKIVKVAKTAAAATNANKAQNQTPAPKQAHVTSDTPPAQNPTTSKPTTTKMPTRTPLARKMRGAPVSPPRPGDGPSVVVRPSTRDVPVATKKPEPVAAVLPAIPAAPVAPVLAPLPALPAFAQEPNVTPLPAFAQSDYLVFSDNIVEEPPPALAIPTATSSLAPAAMDILALTGPEGFDAAITKGSPLNRLFTLLGGPHSAKLFQRAAIAGVCVASLAIVLIFASLSEAPRPRAVAAAPRTNVEHLTLLDLGSATARGREIEYAPPPETTVASPPPIAGEPSVAAPVATTWQPSPNPAPHPRTHATTFVPPPPRRSESKPQGEANVAQKALEDARRETEGSLN